MFIMMEFLKICRACSSEKTNLLNLFANDCDDEPTLGEKFLVCTSLDLQEADEYPQHICYSCAKQLETAYKFRKQCERSFCQLQKRLMNSKKELEKAVKIEPSENKKRELESICLDDDDVLEDHVQMHSNQDELEGSPEISAPIKAENFQSENEENISIIAAPEVESNTERIADTDIINEKNIIGVDISIEERPHQCNECGKNFFTVRALELHMRLSHKTKSSAANTDSSKSLHIQPANAFLCSICNRNLDSIDDLRMHRILEHGQRSMRCNICGKATKDRRAYKKHLLTHKNSEGESVCRVCGKEYTDSRYLYRHMLYHQEALFKCDEPGCGKSYKVKHKFVEHIRLYHNRQITSDEVRQIQPMEESEAE
ncbi:PR domain zinc finger protein 15-like [Hermetia illucens]|nr:PR domain zinc finger protein 15-like [Hermetia illucens]